MTAYDVTLVTCDPLPEPDPDMRLIRAALDGLELSSRVCVWNSSSVDWSNSPVTLIRSTWDYYHHRDAYLRWAAHVSDVSTLLNPVEVVEWNSHKSYLLDLESRGIPIVSTVLVSRGDDVELADLCAENGWDKIVVKPAVSAASFQTHVVDCEHVDEDLFDRLVADRDMLVQPFVEEVESAGERSLILIDGELSHAVEKSPRYHGQDERITGPLAIAEQQAELAWDAVGVVDDPLLYARVDMVETASKGPLITELELIEPSLFLDYAENDATTRLAEALAARVSSARGRDTPTASTSRARS
jgi:nucleotide-binding universal stress UspA family protein